MPSLKDIAQMVGVSISTVSRVINNDTSKHISADTKNRVWEAVKALNYKPNETPRRLMQKKMNQVEPESQPLRIGCILSLPNNKYNHPYFSPILAGIEDKLKSLGCVMHFIRTEDEIREDLENHQFEGDGKPDGLIFVEGVEKSLYQRLKEVVPFSVGIDISDPTVPVIAYDRVIAAKAATQHLIEQGHEQIGFIGGVGLTGDMMREKRFRGFREALERAGLPVNPDWIMNSEWDVDLSYACMKNLLHEHPDHLPTAMFCASDMMAISAMRAVTEAGLRIPEDIAFIGLDNIDFAKYTSPALSSVHIPKYEMGLAATKTLLDWMDGAYPMPFRMVLPFELMIRESSIHSQILIER
ncbi:LacI family DNA-binding transcriptional regulator [Paenibacillus terrigena]|uniref:LacI family DNA-binding transcriptional regulator n=1 Tax=Paenibacillus terrigena TaxID=369333 RepID=UPI000374E25A|nr:LacI family DNA-binding transcriptional regulator [Paenibacillus terrigena]